MDSPDCSMKMLIFRRWCLTEGIRLGWCPPLLRTRPRCNFEIFLQDVVLKEQLFLSSSFSNLLQQFEDFSINLVLTELTSWLIRVFLICIHYSGFEYLKNVEKYAKEVDTRSYKISRPNRVWCMPAGS